MSHERLEMSRRQLEFRKCVKFRRRLNAGKLRWEGFDLRKLKPVQSSPVFNRSVLGVNPSSDFQPLFPKESR